MTNIKIIPAILPKNLKELEVKLNLLKLAYLILDEKEKLMVQIDLCNNEFFENFDFSLLEEYTEIFDFELDLMNIDIGKINERLNNPSVHGELSKFNRVIFHYEDWYENPVGVVPPFGGATPTGFSPKIGLALLPRTRTEKINPYLDKISFIQFMGIDEVGYQGSCFNPKVIEKIKEFKKQNPNIIVSIDGGVNLENAQSLVNAGIDRLVSGSAIFGRNNNEQQIVEKIKEFNKIKKNIKYGI